MNSVFMILMLFRIFLCTTTQNEEDVREIHREHNLLPEENNNDYKNSQVQETYADDTDESSSSEEEDKEFGYNLYSHNADNYVDPIYNHAYTERHSSSPTFESNGPSHQDLQPRDSQRAKGQQNVHFRVQEGDKKNNGGKHRHHYHPHQSHSPLAAHFGKNLQEPEIVDTRTERHHQRDQVWHGYREQEENGYRALELNETPYINVVLNYLKNTYWKNEITPQKRINEVGRALSVIHNVLRNNKRSLIIFTAHSIFSTDGFKKLESSLSQWGKWKSRGLIQLTTKANYQFLSRIIGDDYFLRNPAALATLSDEAVRASALYWKRMIRDNFRNAQNLSFWEVLAFLSPEEVNNPYDYRRNLIVWDRVSIYQGLADSFDL